MPRTYLNPSTLASSTVRYSHVGRSGNTLYISGQVAADQAGNLVGANDIEAQSRQVYRNLEAALASAGGGLADIGKTTSYLTSRDSFQTWSKVRQEIWKGNPPASTLLIVAGLANPGYMVEVDAIAVLGDR